jgi:hypothetical protein
MDRSYPKDIEELHDHSSTAGLYSKALISLYGKIHIFLDHESKQPSLAIQEGVNIFSSVLYYWDRKEELQLCLKLDIQRVKS